VPLREVKRIPTSVRRTVLARLAGVLDAALVVLIVTPGGEDRFHEGRPRRRGSVGGEARWDLAVGRLTHVGRFGGGCIVFGGADEAGGGDRGEGDEEQGGDGLFRHHCYYQCHVDVANY